MVGKGTNLFCFMYHEKRSDKGHLQLMKNEVEKLSWRSKCQEELMCWKFEITKDGFRHQINCNPC